MRNSSTDRRSFTQMALMALGALSLGPAALAQKRVVHMAVSMDLLAGANLNDSRVAYRVWADQVIQKFSLHNLEVLPDVIYPTARIQQMIRSGQLDCFTVSALEIYRTLPEIDLETIAVQDYAANGMDYLLLVNAASPYTKIEDLKKTHIICQQHRDNILLLPWIETLLAAAHHADSAQFFDSVETRIKVNEVILPLFFRKVDAVALTRRAFNMATELNPQLGRQLRVLAVSPKLIVDAFLFRKGCDPVDKRIIFTALSSIGSSQAGKQLLTLYESGSFVQRPGSVINGTLELIRQYERIKN